MSQPTVATISANEGQPRVMVIACHGWKGWVPDLSEIPDRFRRPGQAGSGRQSLGREARAVDVQIWIAFATKAECLDTAADLEALVDFTVTIRDPWARSFEATINAVTCSPIATRGPLVAGGRATHRLEATINLERQSDDA